MCIRDRSRLDKDWLMQLKDRLQSGQWLERNLPDGRAGVLDTVMVGLDYHMDLLYKLNDADGYFQIFIRPDGTEVEDAIWSSAQDSEPELYTGEEMSVVEEHIKRTFGEFDHVFHELVSPDIHVDICIVPPSEKRDYYTLVTMGMGAHRMNVPDVYKRQDLNRTNSQILV